MTQLILMPGDDDGSRPLPEIIVANLGGEMLHIDRDGVRYYRVIDWAYEVLGSKAKDRGMPWRVLKTRIAETPLQNVTHPWIELEYATSNGVKSSDFATDEGLYRVTQHMSNRSQTVREVKAYLAKAGVLVDEFRREPSKMVDAAAQLYEKRGKSSRWISERVTGKVVRRQFTDALTAACIEVLSGFHYGMATNSIYNGLWGRTAAILRNEMGIKKGVSIRDNLPTIALSYLTIVEEFASQQLGQRSEITFEEAHDIVKRVAHLIGQQAKQTARNMGIDLPTGRPLLSEGGTE